MSTDHVAAKSIPVKSITTKSIYLYTDQPTQLRSENSPLPQELAPSSPAVESAGLVEVQ